MKIISHRGANREFPENTLAAFERALEIGVDGLETDLQLTRDGELVLCHDDEILGQGKKRRIKTLSLAELKEIDVGRGHHVATFDEFLNRFSGKAALLLDVKSQGAGVILAQRLKKQKHLDQIHVSSFHEEEILAVKKVIPQVSPAMIFSAVPGDVAQRCARLGIRELSLSHQFLSQEIVQKLLDLQMVLAVYTVNSPSEARRLEAWGVHAIFTDDPGAMQTLRQARV